MLKHEKSLIKIYNHNIFQILHNKKHFLRPKNKVFRRKKRVVVSLDVVNDIMH